MLLHEHNGNVARPPLRRFQVNYRVEGVGVCQAHIVAHLVFDNRSRGDGLIFRRYYDDNVRTEVVAMFQPDMWDSFYEVPLEQETPK
jgi:hypothetical protein